MNQAYARVLTELADLMTSLDQHLRDKERPRSLVPTPLGGQPLRTLQSLPSAARVVMASEAALMLARPGDRHNATVVHDAVLGISQHSAEKWLTAIAEAHEYISIWRRGLPGGKRLVRS